MGNISKVIGILGKLEGNAARMTVSGKSALKIAEAKGAPTELTDALSGLVRKHPKLKADIGYKVSEQGFTVGTVTLRDGKQVVGTAAGSVSGLGTDAAVLKARMQLGKNGEILQYRGFNDLAHTPRIQDAEVAASLKNGVLETSSKNGKAGAASCRIDIPKATEAIGLKEEAALALKKGNSFIGDTWNQLRNLLAGKEFKIPEFSPFGKKQMVNKLEVKNLNIKQKDINDVLMKSKNDMVKEAKVKVDFAKIEQELKAAGKKINES